MLDKMAAFANSVRSGQWKGHTGKSIRNVVNIGIGGSDLGPVMAYEALKYYSDRAMTFRFVSNVDGTDFVEATRDLDAAGNAVHRLLEDLHDAGDHDQRAHTARDWSLRGLGGDAKAVAKHFVAVSTNAEKVAKFGIDTANMFEFWDWVGGRYSMDSAIGLSTMLRSARSTSARCSKASTRSTSISVPPRSRATCRCSWDFRRLVQRLLRRPDRRGAALRPVPEALPGLSPAADDGEQRQARDARRYARGLPDRSDLLGRAGNQRPALLLSIDPSGHPAHSLRLHCVPAQPLNRLGRHHDMLLANVFAQTEALAFGKTREQVKAEGTPDWLVPHRVFEGNRPSNTILLDRLTRPRSGNWLRCTSTASLPRARSGTSIRSISGASNSARSWRSASSRSSRASPSPSSATTARPTT